MKIKIIKEPPVFGPSYAKEALVGLALTIDEKAPKRENAYAVKNEVLIEAIKKKGDTIALGWWQEHFWPPKERWTYIPKECCE
ncbi:MAG: hypothetical protein ABIK76_05245 [candidate division WOR-3 bacterium]